MHSESTGICPGMDHGTQEMAESMDMSLSMGIYPSCKTRDIHTISTQAMSPHSLFSAEGDGRQDISSIQDVHEKLHGKQLETAW